MCILTPFILKNFLKILRADPELWQCAIFGAKMAHLTWTNFFWYKRLLLLSSTDWPFSLYKKFLLQIQTYEDVQFLGQKWEFFSENLLMNLVSFIHAYLHAKNQNQILIY